MRDRDWTAHPMIDLVERIRELLPKLRQTRLAATQPRMPDDDPYREPVNPDGPAAADAIEQLLREKQALAEALLAARRSGALYTDGEEQTYGLSFYVGPGILDIARQPLGANHDAG